MEPTTLSLVVLAASALLSFFLSGMEAGVFALSPARIRHWMRQGRPRAGLLHGFLQDPEDFFWTILVGNTLANVVIVALFVMALYAHLAHRPLLALGAFVGGVFLFYALLDLLPKMLFRAYPNRLCLSLVGVFRWVHGLLQPLVRSLQWLSSRLLRVAGAVPQHGRLFSSREELRLLLQDSSAALTSEERAMIGRVLELSTVRIGQLATPMDRVVTVPASAPMGEVLRLCRERRLTRLPVWQEGGGVRRIAGVVSLKTLLYREALDVQRPAGEFLTPALYLSEDSPVEQVLRLMQRGGQRLAILLGPAQRETGVVSLQDILRFIFGEVTE